MHDPQLPAFAHPLAATVTDVHLRARSAVRGAAVLALGGKVQLAPRLGTAAASR